MESRDGLLGRVAAEAAEAGWWKPEAAVVAAVSGGPDSMALLHMLKAMRGEVPTFRVVAAHVNHGFRGAEAEAEEELVRTAAAEWNIPFVSAALDIPAYMEETGMNPQAAAREKRYDFLLSAAESSGASHLLFGHHADDQAETVLMRILRGTGIGGLAGIPYRRTERNVELVRPLLRITKEEILSYCRRYGVPYAVDSSNLGTDYFRNAVRLELIPALEAYNPRLKESLVRLADLASADEDCLEAEAEALFARMAVRHGGGFRLERREFKGLHVALQRRLIKLILKYCSDSCHFLPFRQVEELLGALAEDRPSVNRIDIGRGWAFIRAYDEIRIEPPQPERNPFRHPVTELPCVLTPGTSGMTMRFERVEGAATSAPDNRREAFFDESDLRLPLIVRSREPGDRMAPAGLNGTKKVQDMFVDAKIPRRDRDQWPLLTDAEGEILWIPGLRRSRFAFPRPGAAAIRVSVHSAVPTFL